MRLLPCDDRVVIEPDPAFDQTPGGVLLPDVAKRKPQVGTIIAVGPGLLNDRNERLEMPYAAGDRVLYPPHAGFEFTPPGQRDPVRVVPSRDVLAKIEEDRPATNGRRKTATAVA